MLQDTTAKAGQTIVLECRVSNPKAEVKWYKNGYQLFTYDRIKVSSEGQRRAITIKKVEARDYGLYECECGKLRTSAELKVLGKSLKDNICSWCYSVQQITHCGCTFQP